MSGFAYPKDYVKFIDVFRQRYFRYDNLVNIFNGLFPGGHEGRAVLDVGCGTGSFALTMADAGYHVVGVDASEESIELALDRVEGRNAEFFKQDFYNPDLGNRKFDLITQLHIPMEIDGIRRMLAQFRQYLHEDGFIAQMYVRKAVNLVSDDKLELDQYTDPDGQFRLVRFNQWVMNDLQMRVFFVAMIEQDGKSRMEFDKTRIEIVPKGGMIEHEFYQQVADIPSNNFDSAPPWTEEYLQILKHKQS
jgi:ubiquinone/menaquinone biosynthesis C-methylase UbiE